MSNSYILSFWVISYHYFLLINAILILLLDLDKQHVDDKSLHFDSNTNIIGIQPNMEKGKEIILKSFFIYIKLKKVKLQFMDFKGCVEWIP